MIDRDPRFINPKDLGLSDPAGLMPLKEVTTQTVLRDGRGIRWSELKNDEKTLKDTVETEVRKLLPGECKLTIKLLRTNKLSGLEHAIIRYYPGGLSALRKTLGDETNPKPRSYWQDPEAVKQETVRFMEDEGGFSFNLLSNKGRNDLSIAIRRHYQGGMKQLRKDLNLEPRPETKPLGFWNNQETIESEALNFFEEEGTLSFYALLRKRGSLARAILKKYPGGMHSLREKLSIPDPRNKKKVLPEEADQELRKLIEE